LSELIQNIKQKSGLNYSDYSKKTPGTFARSQTTRATEFFKLLQAFIFFKAPIRVRWDLDSRT